LLMLLSDEKYLFEFYVEEIINIQVILRHSASILSIHILF